MFGQYLASYYSAVLNRAGEAIISMIGRSGEWFFFFFLNDPPPTEIYPLSLHDALPISPLLKRTDDFWTWSSHVSVTSKPYFSLSCLRGGWLNSHIPSSARSEGEKVTIKTISAVDRKSTRLNSSHGYISYAVFCLKKKKT